MYYVMVKHQDVQIAGACTHNALMRKGYWCAFVGTWSECREFVNTEA